MHGIKEDNKVGLIEYSRPWDISFCVSHAAGAVFGIAALIMSFIRTGAFGSMIQQISALIYCLAFIFVYGSSALYHALPPGRAFFFPGRVFNSSAANYLMI